MHRRRYREITILVPEDDPAAAGFADDIPDDIPKGVPDGWSDGGPAADPFPRERFGALIARLPRYLRLAWGLAGEPSLPRSRRAAVLGAAAYLVSPVDLVPGIIPVVGQLDDVAVAILALRAALRALDEPTRLRVLTEAGLSQRDLDDDLATVGLAARWLARRGARLGASLTRIAAVTAVRASRAGVRIGGDIASRVAPVVASGARVGATKAASGARAGAATAASGAKAGAATAASGAAAGAADVSRALGSGVRSAGRVLGGRIRRSPAAEEPEPPSEPGT